MIFLLTRKGRGRGVLGNIWKRQVILLTPNKLINESPLTELDL